MIVVECQFSNFSAIYLTINKKKQQKKQGKIENIEYLLVKNNI